MCTTQYQSHIGLDLSTWFEFYPSIMDFHIPSVDIHIANVDFHTHQCGFTHLPVWIYTSPMISTSLAWISTSPMISTSPVWIYTFPSWSWSFSLNLQFP